ncbi:HlyD family secretion protein [Altibacter sp. HG106]|uniref:HlyD family secretion protein n=1 Tax=Altibacter sp. HG106 TaxID=3023937 RepID=UPI00234FBE18|nr:biotin/lipoyl-binding protein [Altibacter sp. HG106]MDC7994056.1 HlyD family efflux transporter periplasmic adaptor subunit [Altibacter sp. HG106]
MLNISKSGKRPDVNLTEYSSGRIVFHKRHYQHFNRFLLLFAVIALIIIFLPWTQTVTGTGSLTTLTPEQRPQTIQSPIPGKIEQWYVREGDFVAKGDTILHISEVKNEYFDPNLVSRTGEQINSKSQSVTSYKNKVKALEFQISALTQERQLKLEQAKNKLAQAKLTVKSDSIDLEAAKTNQTIAERQFERINTLQQEGLKSLTEVEERRLKLQETAAKLVSQENKFLASKNEVINAQVELNRIQAEYADKIAKAQSDKFTAQSNQFDTEAQVSKLQNDYTNYEIRSSMYYVRAPQNGYINKAIRSGVGETFKEGEQLVSIMPSQYEKAVETFVDPIDVPLIHLGEKMRIRFDGWPAIVFSGWPNLSYGTYGGEVVAIENYISTNGKYRVLLAPDSDDHEWPKDLRIGGGAFTLALLEDVPIWYEVWRQLNGFPPNFYTPNTNETAQK